jgi:hypothetical protein
MSSEPASDASAEAAAEPSQAGPDVAPRLEVVPARAGRPRRRWYDTIPAWRWASVLVPALAGVALAIRVVGSGLFAFLAVTALFVLVPPACAVAVVALLISAWRSPSWRRRWACILLAVPPAALLYTCASAYDRVMTLFFSGR